MELDQRGQTLRVSSTRTLSRPSVRVRLVSGFPHKDQPNRSRHFHSRLVAQIAVVSCLFCVPARRAETHLWWLS